jgi:hypothetical protein
MTRIRPLMGRDESHNAYSRLRQRPGRAKPTNWGDFDIRNRPIGLFRSGWRWFGNLGFGCQWFENLGFGCQDECDSSLPVWNAVRVGGGLEIWASAARTNAIRPYGMWGNVNVGGIAIVNGRSIPDPVGTNRVRPGRAKPTNLGNLNIRNKPIEFTTIHLGRTKPKNRKNLSAIDPIAGSLKSPHGKGLGLLSGGLKLCR